MSVRSKLLTATAVVVSAGFVLSGCSSSEGPAESEGPVELVYWTWSPGTAEAIAVWNENNPDIQVKTVDMGRSDEQSAKLLAAMRAGEGPDIFQAEYHTLPSFVVADVALDISDYVGDVKGDFTDSIWNLVNLEGLTYGVPVDVAPMALFYRTDIFEEAGVEVPTTWDEYRAAAQTIVEVRPDVTMTLFGSTDVGQFTGLSQQLGGSWWDVQDGAWSVHIDDDANKQVAEYWQSLTTDGLVRAEPWWTPEFSNALTSGKVASFPAGAWFAGSIGNQLGEGNDQLDKWNVAPLPVWDEGDPSGFMGGSAASVTTGSEHPEAAAKVLAWLSADPVANEALSNRAEYPASKTGQGALSGSPANGVAAGQDDFYSIIAEIALDTADVGWGPNANSVFTAYRDELGRAITAGSSWPDMLTKVQDFAIEDLEESGFEVN
ncbi:ABC transporter substrate-binding protein [Microbacterium sp. A93]|uniref:ABC transporter substrate-binding protein n=1 Tax=Microbacterium sp. A93 TaxID=3450716 RepID=UPI003F426B5D